MVVAAAIREEIEIPEGVEVIIENNEVSVKGPNGENSRKFTYPNVSIKEDEDKVVLETAFPKKKDKAMIGTTRAHINNMITGVTDGFEYHMKIVYAHFPMKVEPKKDTVVISNFLGEKYPRTAKIVGDTKVVVKGDEGTKVKLTLLRNNSETVEYEVERRSIKIYHVQSEMLDGNIGYIEMATFDEGCSEEFANAYSELKQKGAKKVIIDLRNNTGGIVDEALNIVDNFVDKGNTVLITVDNNKQKQFIKANTDKKYDDELVVLVNEYSASASEIMVGALRDNGCLKSIVGTKTYGKGVIQSVYSLKNGGVLKLTTEEYYTPNENPINKVGIEPDVVIEENDDMLTDGKYDKNKDQQLQKAIEIIKGN